MLQKRRRKLLIEQLEDRTLLSGSVLVTQTLFGAITITGDNANNRYTVLKNGTNITVTGILKVVF